MLATLLHDHPGGPIERVSPAFTFIVLAFLGEFEVQVRAVERVAEAHGRFAAIEVVRLLDIQVTLDAVGAPDFMRAVVKIVPRPILVEIESHKRVFGIRESPSGEIGWRRAGAR